MDSILYIGQVSILLRLAGGASLFVKTILCILFHQERKIISSHCCFRFLIKCPLNRAQQQRSILFVYIIGFLRKTRLLSTHTVMSKLLIRALFAKISSSKGVRGGCYQADCSEDLHPGKFSNFDKRFVTSGRACRA